MRHLLTGLLLIVLAVACAPAQPPLFSNAEYAQCRAVAWLSTRSVAVPEMGLTHDIPPEAFARRDRLETALEAYRVARSSAQTQSMAGFERRGDWDREWEAAIILDRARRDSIFAECERRLGLS